MELDRLYVFDAVAREGSIVGASRLLNMSPAAVSWAIHMLENELGMTLIEKRGRGVGLTAEAFRIERTVRGILEEVQWLKSVIEEVAAIRGGTVNIGCTTALATGCVVDAVGEFVGLFPGVRVVFHSHERSASVVEMVSRGLCEVGFVGEKIHKGSILALHVCREQLRVVVPGGFERIPPGGGRNDVIWLGELESGPWISGPVGSSLREPLERAFGALGMQPRIVVETDHRDVVPSLVCSGAGIALLPPKIAQGLAASAATIIEVRPAIEVDVFLVYKSGMLSPLGKAFIEVVGRRVS